MTMTIGGCMWNRPSYDVSIYLNVSRYRRLVIYHARPNIFLGILLHFSIQYTTQVATQTTRLLSITKNNSETPICRPRIQTSEQKKNKLRIFGHKKRRRRMLVSNYSKDENPSLNIRRVHQPTTKSWLIRNKIKTLTGNAGIPNRNRSALLQLGRW